MAVTLRRLWVAFSESLWFIPAVMSAIGMVAAYGLVRLDIAAIVPGLGDWMPYGGTAESGRRLVSTMLSGMITMTSLVVSITMVVLTLAASQLGPRIIKSFIGDRSNQAVLGLFVSTILFLLIIYSILDGGTDVSAGTHRIAVSAAITLFVANFFVLLYFVHKMAQSITNDSVVRDLWSDLMESIRHDLDTNEEDDAADVPPFPDDADGIRPSGYGYIGFIDYRALVRIARREEARLRVAARIGEFVTPATTVVEIAPAERLDDDVKADILGAVAILSERTPVGDLSFKFRQLVEVGVRALSPGLNDPHTAVNVIDYLGAGVAEVFARNTHPAALRDDDGHVVLTRAVHSYGDIAEAAFDQIRNASVGHPLVLLRIGQALSRLVPVARDVARRDAVLQQLELLGNAGEQALAGRDADRLARLCSEIRDALG